MAEKIANDIISKRKQEFSDYLKEILPEEKKELVKKITSMNNDQFINLFKFFISPVKHNPELIIKMIDENFGISDKDVTRDELSKLKKYVDLFCMISDEI